MYQKIIKNIYKGYCEVAIVINLDGRHFVIIILSKIIETKKNNLVFK